MRPLLAALLLAHANSASLRRSYHRQLKVSDIWGTDATGDVWGTATTGDVWGTAATTCANVLSSTATDKSGSFTCGQRIDWLKSSGGGSLADSVAKNKIASEFPDICGACATGASPAPAPAPVPSGGGSFSVVTQNLYWWNLFGQRGGANFFNKFASYGPYDIMLFQECDNVWHILDKGGYAAKGFTATSGNKAVAVAWDGSKYNKLATGKENVAEDRPEQYYGYREVVWARLQEKSSGRVVFAMSHHGPLPIDTGGKQGGQETARRIKSVINSNMQPTDTLVLGGDFNAGSGYSTMTKLKESYTLLGSDWVDHILTNGVGVVMNPRPAITVVRDTGSDHRGLKADFIQK